MKQVELVWQKSGTDSFYAYLPETDDRAAFINTLKKKRFGKRLGKSPALFS